MPMGEWHSFPALRRDEGGAPQPPGSPELHAPPRAPLPLVRHGEELEYKEEKNKSDKRIGVEALHLRRRRRKSKTGKH
jgi:hypothetical protein